MANIIHSFCWTMSTGSVHSVEKKQYLADVKILDGYLQKDCIKSIFSIISDAFAVKNGDAVPYDSSLKKVFVLQEEITAGSLARRIAEHIIIRCVNNESTIHIESVTVYCDDGNFQEYAPKGGFEYKSFNYASNVTTKPLPTCEGTLQRMQEDGERSEPKNIPAMPDSEKKESYRETIDNIKKKIMSENEGKVPTMIGGVSMEEFAEGSRRLGECGVSIEEIEQQKKKQWEESQKAAEERESADECSEESEGEGQQNVSVSINPVCIDMSELMNKVLTYISLVKTNEGNRYATEINELESFFFHFGVIVGADFENWGPFNIKRIGNPKNFSVKVKID